jgi:AAA+ superfamily predicted ATPase
MTTSEKTRSQIKADDVYAELRSRNPFLWIRTSEERRATGYIVQAAAAAKMVVRLWDIAGGSTDINGVPDDVVSEEPPDPEAVLKAIRERASDVRGKEQCVWILRDYPTWLQGPSNAITLRRLRTLIDWLPEQPLAHSIIIMSPTADVPPELRSVAKVIEWPLPDRAELGAALDAAVAPYVEKGKIDALTNGARAAAIDAAVGLCDQEAQASFAKSLVQFRRIDAKAVTQEKKRAITQTGGAEWIDPLDGGMDAVGGLDEVKEWLDQISLAYSPAARAYGLPAPKGALLAGVPGCGKSLLIRAVASAQGVPCIKIDLGAMKGKFVGESEANIRKVFGVAEALGRCILWIDEIEKAMAGSTDGSADGGVSADALGFLLTWMQEHPGEAFVMATANDASKLPAELLRKGRFDEVWWVDFPNPEERKAVMAATLRTFKRDPSIVDLDAIADATNTFTGAEIAALVPAAMFAAFADSGREINTDDILTAAIPVVPMATSQAEKLAKLKESLKARPATRSQQAVAVVTSGGRRALDI